MSWPQIRKIVVLKYHLLLFYATTMDHFSTRLWRVMKRILYHNWRWQAWWLDREEVPQALPKAKLAPQKGHGHCLVVWCLSDPLHFLNSGETITSEKYAQQINEMHQKLQRLQPVLVNRMGPNSPWQHLTACLKTNVSKVERIELRSLAPSTIFTWRLANRLPLL